VEHMAAGRAQQQSELNSNDIGSAAQDEQMDPNETEELLNYTDAEYEGRGAHELQWRTFRTAARAA
jgi:hypothetical protein